MWSHRVIRWISETINKIIIKHNFTEGIKIIVWFHAKLLKVSNLRYTKTTLRILVYKLVIDKGMANGAPYLHLSALSIHEVTKKDLYVRCWLINILLFQPLHATLIKLPMH